MKNKVLKEKLFHKCVKYFNIATKENTTKFICPICLNSYNFDSLTTDDITFEHVPPKSLDGKLKILTCKRCNSILGSKIDSQVAKMDKLKNSLTTITSAKGSYSGAAYYEINDIKLNVELKIIDSNINLNLKTELNDPNILNDFNLNRKIIPSNKEFKITPKINYNQRLANISLLKNSYLISFAYFGYSYILSKNLSIVRKQILNFNENIIDVFTLMQPGSEGLEIMKIESPISGIGVKINNIAIILPWFDSHIDFYGKLNANYKRTINRT